MQLKHFFTSLHGSAPQQASHGIVQAQNAGLQAAQLDGHAHFHHRAVHLEPGVSRFLFKPHGEHAEVDRHKCFQVADGHEEVQPGDAGQQVREQHRCRRGAHQRCGVHAGEAEALHLVELAAAGIVQQVQGEVRHDALGVELDEDLLQHALHPQHAVLHRQAVQRTGVAVGVHRPVLQHPGARHLPFLLQAVDPRCIHPHGPIARHQEQPLADVELVTREAVHLPVLIQGHEHAAGRCGRGGEAAQEQHARFALEDQVVQFHPILR